MSHRLAAAAFLALILVAPAGAQQELQPSVRELGPLPDAHIEYLAPSPDGTLVAMTAYPPDGEAALWVFNRGSGELIVVARGDDFDAPVWSPSGDRIAFGRPDEGGDPRLDYRIYAIPMDHRTGRATGPVRRVSTSRGLSPAFSPDGLEIAFVWTDEESGDRAGIALVPANGGEERRLPSSASPNWWLTWATDGWLYYDLPEEDRSAGAYRVERIHPGTGASELVARTAGPAWPGMTRDGRLVAYTADPQRGNRVRALARAGGGELGRFELPDDLHGEAWAPDRAALLAARVVVPRTIETVPLDGGARQVMVAPAEGTRRPAWSPDGTRLAYQTIRDGGYVIAVREAESGETRVYATAEPGIATMSWSPDGRLLLYRTSNLSGLGLLDVETGADRMIASSGFIGLSVWRADGRSIVYVRRPAGPPGSPTEVRELSRDGADRLLRRITREEFPRLRGVVVDNERLAYVVLDSMGIVGVPLDGGAPRQLAHGPHLRPESSIDGAWIASPVAPPGPSRPTEIDIIPTAGGQPRRLALGFELVNSDQNNIQWHDDGLHLVTIGQRPGAAYAQIFLIPLNGDPPRPIADLNFPSEFAQLDLSSVAGRVAYTRASRPRARLVEFDFGDVARAP